MPKQCNCFSYNAQEGETPNEILDPNKYFDWDSEAKTVCVDACIADAIKMLWENGVWTRGCCCGHGERKPNVVIDRGEFPTGVQGLLDEYDNRDWQVLQWQLINCTTGENFNHKRGK